MSLNLLTREELLEKIKKLALTKQLNFLIGSGTSLPAIPLMGMVEVDEVDEDGGNDEERNKKRNAKRNEKLTKIVRHVSEELLDLKKEKIKTAETTINVSEKKILTTLKNYEHFLSSIIEVLNLSNSRQNPRTVNIFTTNYDLFIEKASDEVLQNYRFVFNDGASGYFDRKLDGANYNRTVSYKGLNDNYTNEIPSVTLIKPHGSVNWEKNNDTILIRNEVVEESVVVKPTGFENEETFLSNHFHDMLRIFQLELDKPQSVLFVIGFSFQDSHIAKMVKRAMQNPELMIFAFGYNESDRKTFIDNLGIRGDMSNVNIITPNNLSENYTTKMKDKDGNDYFVFTLENFNYLLNSITFGGAINENP